MCKKKSSVLFVFYTFSCLLSFLCTGCIEIKNGEIRLIASDPTMNRVIVLTKTKQIRFIAAKNQPPKLYPWVLQSFDLALQKYTSIDTLSVTAGFSPYSKFDLAPAQNKLLFFEDTRLISLDLTTGERIIVSGEQLGAGPLLTSEKIIFDALVNRLIVAEQGDSSMRSFYAVDLASGNRSLLATVDFLTNEAIYIRDLVIDTQSHRLFISYNTFSDGIGLLSLDLNTMTQTLLLDTAQNIGPTLPIKSTTTQGLLYYAPENTLILQAGLIYMTWSLTTNSTNTFRILGQTEGLELIADTIIIKSNFNHPSSLNLEHPGQSIAYLTSYDLLTNTYARLESKKIDKDRLAIISGASIANLIWASFGILLLPIAIPLMLMQGI